MKPIPSKTLVNAFNSEDSLFSARSNKDKTGYDITTIYLGKEVIVASFYENEGRLTSFDFDPKCQYPNDLIAADVACMPDGKSRDTILISVTDELHLSKELANKLRDANQEYFNARKKEIQNYNIAKTMVAQNQTQNA